MSDNFDKIDISKLKRNYIKCPVKKIKSKRSWTFEKPYKEDLEYLYNECNLTIYDLYKYFSNVSHHTVQRWISYYKIVKDKEKHYKNIENITVQKYGKKFYNNRKKYFQTNLKKYGCIHPCQNNDVKKKQEETFLQKYGVKNPSLLNTVKEKIRNKMCIIIPKMRKTMLEKYGFESAMQIDEIRNKRFKTMIENKSFNKSNEEEKIFDLLNKKYYNVQRQYQSNVYPFNCDFYIPQLDLYIEYQGYWTHGFEKYLGTEEQLEKVKLWESKNKKQYKRAIKTWTVKDVEKRNIAKKNKLNYLEFFNIDEFMEWYNKN